MKKITVNNTKLMVVDDLEPENAAMLQALYSRSIESAEDNLERLRQSGSNKFMESFYVGYGHKSIADCGSATLFIEGVSMLAAKAIQDSPLYSGQETSTRYVDMRTRRIEDPVNTPMSKKILDRWMEFYFSSQEKVAATIRSRYPKKPDEKEETYERAVAARTFDSLRGFLPAGITTQLSWHSNLRQLGDRLNFLTKHPANEIKQAATALRQLLAEQYPSSGFGRNLAGVSCVHNKDEAAEEERTAWEQDRAHYFAYNAEALVRSFRTTINNRALEAYAPLLKTRPRGCVLPHFMSDLGQVTFAFGLDFGSFRDIQRHRNGVCRMPLLTTENGFEPWYLDQLDPGLRIQAENLIAAQVEDIERASDDVVSRQYLTAMGFIVPCSVTYALPAAVYVMELRSGRFIHPTLRKTVHRMITDFEEVHPLVKLHVDLSSDDWDVRRGMQTITKKESE